jgi:FkbM family methyltransferase
MSSAPKPSRVRLEGGLELWCLDPFEARFLQRDVDAYFEGGVTVAPGATILDVGANIGMFAAAASRRLDGQVRLLCFEPMPPVHAVLALNAALIPGAIEALPFGLSDAEATLEFTFFPLMSCLSSTRRGAENLAAERQRVAASLLEIIRSGEVMPHLRLLPEPMLEGFVEGYVRSRLKLEHHPARVRPLAAVLAERGHPQVDLLKIDVEGAEEAVLDGVGAEDWAQIRQIVLELERFGARIGPVTARLEAQGYRVTAAQDRAQAVGDYGLVYARR